MKTSALLLHESGEPIHDFHHAFSMQSATDDADGPVRIAGSLVIKGIAQPLGLWPVNDFPQVIDRPFVIDAGDIVYLNADCRYDDEVRSAIALTVTHDDATSVRLVELLPEQLEGLDLALEGVHRQEFRRGRPIWQRTARSSNASRGQRATNSAATLALRDAIEAWTVLGEQIIRFAFERAQRDGTDFQHRHRNVAASAEGLIGLALGYYPSGTRFEARKFANLSLVLERFRFKTTHDSARKRQFLRATSTRYAHLGGRAPTQAPRYAKMPGQIAETIKQDIAAFTDRYAGNPFDPRALAAYTATVLVHLRIAHSAALSIDRKRSAAREALRKARTLDDMRDVAHRFSFEHLMAITAWLQPAEQGTRPVKTFVGLYELLTMQDVVVIAMLADLDPRALDPNLTVADQSLACALLDTARWLGRLYRERYAIMSLEQAERLCALANPLGLARDDAEGLAGVLDTMFSFLTLEGRECLQDGAAQVVRDGLARSVFVRTARADDVGPEPTGRVFFRRGFVGRVADAAMPPLPGPIVVRSRLITGARAV
ncbi:hypothetical protein [Methylobacterium isbiliense]|uniref:hypothetical protein n=1 Tax=Methylobacterium isbiliense TaxID=315478 RepID=UPI0025B2D1AC|nr:hypothetical protein [Methylobacterium isbiliense]MDN3627943.1 hypothetical protein [Methylobacterium isbiliense]